MGTRGRVGTLVTDFDGTLTRHDFFDLVRQRLVPPGTPRLLGRIPAGSAQPLRDAAGDLRLHPGGRGRGPAAGRARPALRPRGAGRGAAARGPGLPPVRALVGRCPGAGGRRARPL